jgi:hypothetical protein
MINDKDRARRMYTAEDLHKAIHQTGAEKELITGLKYAYIRLNEIPHKYVDTDFKMLRELLENHTGKKISDIIKF